MGDPAIHSGLVNSQVARVELGLGRGENPNSMFSAEATALQFAANSSLYGRGDHVARSYNNFIETLEIIRALLAHRADPNLRAPSSVGSALEIASTRYNPDAVRMLIEAGATVPAQVAPGSLIDIYVNHRNQFPPPITLPPMSTRVPVSAPAPAPAAAPAPAPAAAATTPVDIPSDREDPITLEAFTEGEQVGCFPNSNPRIRTMCYKLASIQGLIAASRDPTSVKHPETRQVVPVSSIIYGVAHIVPPLGGKRHTRRKHRKQKSKTGKRKTRK
jgi:hypothetical protein